MDNVIKKSNKATLIAAALIITGATAIFGTYAASDETVPPNQPGPLACFERVDNMSEAEKVKMREAHDLMEAGDLEGARAIMSELGLRGPGPRLENLTAEQRARLDEAHTLMQNGDKEGAKIIFEELGLKGPRPKPGKGFQEFRKGLHPKINEVK